MGLKLTPAGLSDELRISKLKVQSHLKDWEQDVASYATPGFKTGFGSFASSPENHNFEWIALNLAKLVAGTPHCRISTTRPGEAEVRAKALTYALNHWARLTHMREKLERFGVDLSIRYAVALVTSEPQPGYVEAEDPPYWPSITRLSIKRFLFDPTALEPEQWQWAAHLTIRNRSDVIAAAESGQEKGWDVKALRALTEPSLKEYRPSDAQRVERDEIAYWEFWVPGEPTEAERDEGYNGRIFTVLDGEEAKDDDGWVREPRDFFGPISGPYVFVGAYPVPDEAVPLAPLVASRQQAEYLNRIKRATILAVEAYKRLLLVRGDDAMVQSIKDNPTETVFKYEGPDVREAAISFEVGGITQQLLVAGEDARQTLDRVSGMFDADRGNVTGDATATENLQAGQASAQRTGFLTTKFMEFTARLFFVAAYYFDRDEDVVLDLPPEAAGQFQGPNGEPLEHPVIRGGMAEGANPDDFNSLDLTIDVGSMTRSVEMANEYKLLQIELTLQSLMLMAPHAAYMNVAKYLSLRAEITGIPELEELANPQMMAAVSMLMLQQGGEAQNAGSKGAQPRLSSDIKPGGGKPARKPTPLEQSGSGAGKPSRPGGKSKSLALPVSSG